MKTKFTPWLKKHGNMHIEIEKPRKEIFAHCGLFELMPQWKLIKWGNFPLMPCD